MSDCVTMPWLHLPNLTRTWQETFGDLAMFFYDQLGGDIVAVVWKPAAFLPCPFRVTEVHNRIPIEVSQLDKVQTVPNIVSILADCQSLGKGLVERIENL